MFIGCHDHKPALLLETRRLQRYSMFIATAAQMDYNSRKLKAASQITSQLEKESHRMDERLQVLRKMMSAEKARRGANGDLHWQSGQRGPPLTQQPLSRNIKVTKENSKKPLRICILTEKNDGVTALPRHPRCGQCEKSTASLSCVECVENFCTVCFAKFHQKGALSKHHVKPMAQKTPKPKVKPPLAGSSTKSTTTAVQACAQRLVTVGPSPTVSRDNRGSSNLPMGSLLEGTYDEAASAASFQQALAEWRRGETKDKSESTVTSKDSSSTTTVSTSTQSAIITRADRSDAKPTHRLGIKVEFPDKEAGVSYLERLMMRRHRVDPMFLAQLSKAKRAAGIQSCYMELKENDQQVASDEDQSQLKSEPSQYNIFYSEEVEEGNAEMGAGISGSSNRYNFEELESFERPLSSVRIEEMHHVCAVPSASPYTSTYNTDDNNVMEKIKIEPKVSAPSAPAQGNCKIKKDPSSSKKPDKQISVKGIKLKTSRGRSSEKSVVDPSQKADEHLEFTESAVAASVRSAWSNSTQAGVTQSSSDQLTKFFLSGVHKSAQEAVEGKSVEDETPNNSQLQFSSTIWLPGNSIAIADSRDVESGVPGDAVDFSFDGNGAGSNKCTINFATDPSPPSMLSVAYYHPPQHELGNSSDISTPTPSYYDSIASSDCESEDLDEPFMEFESEGRKGQQWEEWEQQEDSEALENLAWELASVTGGRLTRCEGEEEEVEEEDRGIGGYDIVAESGIEGEGEGDGCFGSGVEIQQVMSDFELYQQQIMEESD